VSSLTGGWAIRADARRDLIRWIEGWFNARRLHSSNYYNSPIDWENQYHRRDDGIAA
jgi:transposase InsO family protein